MDERRRPYNLFQNEGNISLILYLALLGSICRCRIHETFTWEKEKGFNSKRVFLSCVGHYYLRCVVPLKRHLQYLRSWRLLWVLIGLSTSNVIGQNLPATYRFNGTNAFTTVNYIVRYSTLDIVIQDLVTGRGKSSWPPWDMPMTRPKQ